MMRKKYVILVIFKPNPPLMNHFSKNGQQKKLSVVTHCTDKLKYED